MKKRILSLLLVFAMVFSLIPSTALAVADRPICRCEGNRLVL